VPFLESNLKFAVMTTNSSLFEVVSLCFSDEMIECHRFVDPVALSRAIYREEYQAIIVDWALGVDANQAVFARRACYGDRRAPLIVIGTFDGRDSIEQAFNSGADDVVLSPIDCNELTVRTHLALRRFRAVNTTRAEDTVRFGPYRLDRRSSAVWLDGGEIRLTVREFAIAWLLFSNAGEYVSRRTIAGAIWGSTEDIVGRTLEQHIYKLRRKLNLTGTTGVQLRTMYAHGYRVEMGEEGRCGALDDDDGRSTMKHVMDRPGITRPEICAIFDVHTRNSEEVPSTLQPSIYGLLCSASP
jgi:DNA-binding response OmpR family regulator